MEVRLYGGGYSKEEMKDNFDGIIIILLIIALIFLAGIYNNLLDVGDKLQHLEELIYSLDKTAL